MQKRPFYSCFNFYRTGILCLVGMLSGFLAVSIAAEGDGALRELPLEEAGESTPIPATPATSSTEETPQIPSRTSSVKEYGAQPAFGGGRGTRKRDAGVKREKEESKREAEPMSSSRFGFYVVLYLILLGSVLWGGLYLLKRYLPGGRQLFASPSMEVLGRTHLDPRSYMALVRVGRSVLVVGVGADGMRTLSRIEDAEEVTELLAQSRPKSAAGVGLFQRLFKAQLAQDEKNTDTAETVAKASELQTSMSDLRDRVRNLRELEE